MFQNTYRIARRSGSLILSDIKKLRSLRSPPSEVFTKSQMLSNFACFWELKLLNSRLFVIEREATHLPTTLLVVVVQ